MKEHVGNLNEFTSLGHTRSYLRVLEELADSAFQPLPVTVE